MVRFIRLLLNEKGRFLWSAHRITERQKAGKARSIKGKQLKNSRIAVSKRLYNDQQYKSVLKAGEKYDSLTAAYVAYLLALEEYEKSALDSN